MRLKLKFRRIEKGLSQRQLAEKVGVHVQSISDYERGKVNPGYAVMKKIADTLGGTVDELFYQDTKEVN